MKSDFEIIDNFLNPRDFDDLVDCFVAPKNVHQVGCGWYLNTSIVFSPNQEEWDTQEQEKQKNNQFYMCHTVYEHNEPKSEYYPLLFPTLDKLNVLFLGRIKANLYPNTHKLQEHSMHSDMKSSHKAAILSLNTCDGYTKLEDGTKVDSVANRILLFDGSTPHCSTTTTNAPTRININFNYM